jgi:hypothetical protein
MTEIDMSQQTPDAITSGHICLSLRASAASTVAASIQSCAMLSITSMISRALSSAALPRPVERRRTRILLTP